MIELITAGKIVLLVAVPTTLMLLYLLLRRHDDDEEDGKASQQTIATSRQTVLEIKVPRDVVSTIIGRQGITIKKIQECSGAKLHFWDEATGREEQDRVVVIRGSADAARHAEVMIQKIIADIPEVITEDFYIPNSATGRIIGKGGGNIRSILRTSKAKINIEKSDNRDSKQMRLVTITGSRKQIDVAKQMIEDEVQEMENAEKLHFGEPKEPGRQHRKDASKTDRCSDLSMRAAPRLENWDVDAGGDHIKKNILEVYVMTIKNPGHFWVHVAGSKLMQLKSLMENIRDFYSNLEDSMVYNVLDEVSEGDVIAAYLEDKNTWYRARITEVDGDCLTVFCLDYGYTITVSKSKLRRLKGEFLCLPFQAVECHLAEVTPKGGIWSDRACEMFGEHVHINQSTIISAEIIHYKRAPYGLVPCLRLTDYSDPAHIINVNKELVEQGFAEWIDKTFVGVEDGSIISQEGPFAVAAEV